MQILGLIPARYASTRFPGKPLAMIQGKSMIQRVYEQASKTEALDKVVVATDDQRIFDHVKTFGEVMMSSKAHPSGTDRCNEVLQKLLAAGEHYDVVVNIQGDEPYIQVSQIEQLIQCFSKSETQIATLVKPIHDREELNSPNAVKVVRQNNGKALYFSRYPIPYQRDKVENQGLEKNMYFKHLGIYAYRAAVLTEISQLPKGQLEQAESLEQLRWLENGYLIQTEITNFESVAVDTPDDLLKLTNNS
jgi:3-deoxy-manno-octulosonate cytidylyltransferase (CMP-KDO synthetase)